MNKKIVLVLLILSVFCKLSAQTAISGVVVDKVTREPLPFVNIQILPGNEGASTDFEGGFSCRSSKKVNELKFTYLGYEEYSYKPTESIERSVFIEMNPAGIQIEETVVTGKRGKNKIPKDTIAISLQQRVVDNKENNRPKSFDTYSFKEHTTLEFDYYKLGEKFTNRIIFKPFRYSHEFIDSTETGEKYLPLVLQEKLTENYYQSDPPGEKQVVIGQYMTGIQNMSTMVMLDKIFNNFDLYDNLIIAGGKSFTSPFSVSGLITYRYYVTDSLIEGDKSYYKLEFTPKSRESIAFNGHAWIDASNYAIKSIELSIPKQANINFLAEFKVSQSFEQVDNERWMLSGEGIQAALNITAKKGAKSLFVKKVMTRGDLRVNEEINPKVFGGEKVIISDSIKGLRDYDWWGDNRLRKLSPSEAGVIALSDSIEKTKAFRNYVWLGSLASTAFLQAGPVEFGRFYQFVSWNSIEGIRPKMGIRTNTKFNENLQLWGYVAYGTRDKAFKYFGNVRIMLPKKNNNWHTLEFNYKKDFTFLGQDYEDQQFSHDNMFLAIFRTTPLTKIMLMENLKVTHERQWGNKYSTKFTAGVNSFYAVPDVFDFRHINNDGSVQYYDRFNTSEIGFDQRFTFDLNYFENAFYRFEMIASKPIIDLNYKLGLKNIAGGEFAYHKLEMILRQRLSSKIGYTYYRLMAGKIFGDIPYPLMFIPVGNENVYFNGEAYQLMNAFEFAADEYAAFWLEHHFDGAIFNRIPLVRKLNLRSLVSAKALIGNAKDSNLDFIALPDGMRVPENWYVEVGFGIENILQLLRVDLYWRATQRDVPDIQKFGIKIAIGPKL
jgi:hypothetical protein